MFRAKLLFAGFVSSGVMTVFTMKVLKTRGYQPSIVQQSSYTSYLSLISLILLLEKKLSCGEISAFHVWQLWGNQNIFHMQHVKKFQMSPHDRCGEIWNFPHMACVWCRRRRHTCKIYAIFLSFATIYAFSCGEKLSPKVNLWRKSDKYKVWTFHLFRIT